MKKQQRNAVTFLTLLSAVAHLFTWTTDKNGHIVAIAKGKRKNKETDPISAVVNVERRKQRRATIDDPVAASNEIRLTDEAANQLINAIHGNGSRGYHQVLRGRIKKVVGLTVESDEPNTVTAA